MNCPITKILHLPPLGAEKGRCSPCPWRSGLTLHAACPSPLVGLVGLLGKEIEAQDLEAEPIVVVLAPSELEGLLGSFRTSEGDLGETCADFPQRFEKNIIRTTH